MGLIDTFKNLFSKSGKKASQKKGKAVRHDAASMRKKIKQASPEISLTKKAKGRKKSQRVTADPIDEAALGFSISLKSDDEQAKKRNAVRVSVKGMKVYIPRLKKAFPCSDISATGIGFKFEKPRIKGGVKLKMDILLDGEKQVTGVLCKVMRHERGLVGCLFLEPDRAQDDAIHKLVLLGQKQQAARKTAQKDKNFKMPS